MLDDRPESSYNAMGSLSKHSARSQFKLYKSKHGEAAERRVDQHTFTVLDRYTFESWATDAAVVVDFIHTIAKRIARQMITFVDL